MEKVYDTNGLVFWTEKEIRLRRMFEDHFQNEMRQALLGLNPAWSFFQVEAPILTPENLINPNYTHDDVWFQEGPNPGLVLRPETTPGSYAYAVHLLQNVSTPVRPPFVVWQTGKSFRREQEQVTKNMRLKEFYQQEFQCMFTVDTLNDYHAAILEPVKRMIGEMIHLPTRIVASDRLPSYSLKTMDIEVDNGDKWMEVCSISLRTDFPTKATFQAKGKVIEKELRVLEVAIGLDRMVYNFLRANNHE